MNDSNPQSANSKSRQLDGLCQQFEEAWVENRIRIETFIERCVAAGNSNDASSKPDLEKLAIRLVRTEIDLRRRQGELPTGDEYASRFKFIDPMTLADLISMPLPPKSSSNQQQILPSRYRMVKKIGQGGIGVVWRVFDKLFERYLAAKFLHRRYCSDASANLRLEREALITGSLQHPGVPPVHDFGKLLTGSSFFTMKLVNGETLAEIMKSRDRSDTASPDFLNLIGTFELISQTIAYAHSKKIIHRDLKPQNVMVGQFGEVQIMDWGMAKQLGIEKTQRQTDDAIGGSRSEQPQDRFSVCDQSNGSSPGSGSATNSHGATDSTTQPTVLSSSDPSIPDPLRTLTLHGEVFGTPAYMPPEQARGEIDAMGCQSDVFGLGAILFEILTGNRLYDDVPTEGLVQAAATGNIEFSISQLKKTNVDDELVNLCRDCLQSEPTVRPADGGVVADRVSEYLLSVQQRLKQAELDRSRAELAAEEERKRRRLSTMLVGTILTALVLGSIGYSWFQFDARKKKEANDRTRAATLVDAVATAPADALPYAIENVRPVREYALPIMLSRFDSVQDPVQKYHLALALNDFGEVKVDFLIDHLDEVDPRDLTNVLAALQNASDDALAKLKKRFKLLSDRETRIRLAAIAMNLGDVELAEAMTSESADAHDRVAWIDFARQWNSGLKSFFEAFDNSHDSMTRYSLLAAVAEISESTELIESESYKSKVSELAKSAQRSNVRASAELILRRWGRELQGFEETRPPRDPISDQSSDRNWYCNSVGMVMVQLRIPVPSIADNSEVYGPYSIFISDREVTANLFEQFLEEDKDTAERKNIARPELGNFKAYSARQINEALEISEDAPIHGVGGYTIIRFCNWLSLREDLTPCYELKSNKEIATTYVQLERFEDWVFDPLADGYRLPLPSEFEYFASGKRDGVPNEATTFFEADAKFHTQYEWFLKNSSSANAVARKLPNRFGLFDTVGNMNEVGNIWRSPKRESYVAMLLGSSFTSPNLRLPTGRNQNMNDSGYLVAPTWGFRPVRQSRASARQRKINELYQNFARDVKWYAGDFGTKTRMMLFSGASVLDELGVKMSDQGYEEFALEIFESSREFSKKLMAERPGEVDLNSLADIADSFVKSANSEITLGRLQAAKSSLNKAELRLQSVLNERPNHNLAKQSWDKMESLREQIENRFESNGNQEE